MIRERLLRFGMQMFHMYGLPHDELVRIVKAKKRYPAHYRAEALRHLVADASVSVTGGQPFAERRRRVRRHYGI